VTEYHDGGWSYEALESEFPALTADSLQSVGEKFPPLPDELQRPA
jgi:hypothetical protein